MRSLKSARMTYEKMAAEEARLPQDRSLQETVAQYLAMQQEFEPLLRSTDECFREERAAHLAELQRRLRKVSEWACKAR